MSDFSQPVSIPVSDPDAVLTTTIDVKNGRHQVYCDLCGKLILLTKFAAPGALLEHRSSNRCQELRKRRDKHLEKEYQASVIRSKNTFSSLGPIPSSSGSQTPSAAHSVTPTPPPPSVIPHVNPPLPHNLVPPSLHVPAPTMPISVPVSYRSRRIPEPVCPGIHIHWTPGSFSLHTHTISTTRERCHGSRSHLRTKETWLGIDKDVTWEWRKDYGIPNSDGIEEVKEELKQKRERAETTSVVPEPRRKSARTARR